jgi:hypothetical protein
MNPGVLRPIWGAQAGCTRAAPDGTRSQPESEAEPHGQQ